MHLLERIPPLLYKHNMKEKITHNAVFQNYFVTGNSLKVNIILGSMVLLSLLLNIAAYCVQKLKLHISVVCHLSILIEATLCLCKYSELSTHI